MSIAKKFMSWVDARYPATETYEYHMSKYYAPKKFQLLVFFWCLVNGRLGEPIGNRYLVNHDV